MLAVNVSSDISFTANSEVYSGSTFSVQFFKMLLKKSINPSPGLGASIFYTTSLGFLLQIFGAFFC